MSRSGLAQEYGTAICRNDLAPVMATDVNLLASSMIGDALVLSPYKEQKARADRLQEQLDQANAGLRLAGAGVVSPSDEQVFFVLAQELVAARERIKELEGILQSMDSCWCEECSPVTMEDCHFVVCPFCGNKRCPKASNHRYKCTNSNETGQIGELE